MKNTEVMQTRNLHINKKDNGLFFYLTILTSLFVLLQIGYVIRFGGFYLGDFHEISNHLEIPFRVIPPVLIFIAIQLLIHILFLIFIWAEAQLIGVACHLSWRKVEKVGFYLWGISIAAAVFGNQYYYPNSKFANMTEVLINQPVSGVVFFSCLLVMIAALLLSILGINKLFPKMSIICLLGVGVAFLNYDIRQHAPVPAIIDASSSGKPNIIIIGIDSLRPDFLGYFGYEKNTPHLDDFLIHSTVFSDSLTPIARTFPSWVSILTGRYPKQNGARTNLEDISHLTNLNLTLPNVLKQHGYNTLFSTDETRFSNIDTRYGFDQVVTPPVGFNDFLLGTVNDFPFSNLLVNTQLGRWLFPNSYGNRPVYSTYNPDSFLNMLKPVLAKSRTKPLFMAVHFCLPHTPYTWGTQIPDDNAVRNYQLAIHRVDQQFNDFVLMLKKYKLLDHAIVVVLSDHGEAIELHGDRATNPDLYVTDNVKAKQNIPKFYPPTFKAEPVDRSAGHGTDVLGLTQYHTVLAFRLFGMQENYADVMTNRVSLLDIKPSVLSLLHLKFTKEAGDSLSELILGKKSAVSGVNDFFMESDFSPESIRSVHPETRDVVFEGINYFKIDPLTARLLVKNSMENLILSSKQYADQYGDWILALYPQSKKTMMPVLVNLQTGLWTNDLTSSFARKSPASHMLKAMQNFYGTEITDVL
jgi:arylsulfatase A-like enzyme